MSTKNTTENKNNENKKTYKPNMKNPSPSLNTLD